MAVNNTNINAQAPVGVQALAVSDFTQQGTAAVPPSAATATFAALEHGPEHHPDDVQLSVASERPPSGDATATPEQRWALQPSSFGAAGVSRLSGAACAMTSLESFLALHRHPRMHGTVDREFPSSAEAVEENNSFTAEAEDEPVNAHSASKADALAADDESAFEKEIADKKADEKVTAQQEPESEEHNATLAEGEQEEANESVQLPVRQTVAEEAAQNTSNTLAPIEDGLDKVQPEVTAAASAGAFAKYNTANPEEEGVEEAAPATEEAPVEEVAAVTPERTFIVIKPDGTQRQLVDEIISRFVKKGYKLVGLKFMHPTVERANEHFSVLASKKSNDGLCASSGPIWAMVWEGLDVIKGGRTLLGATNPADSTPGTIHGDYAVDVHNVCHCSDGFESAAKEIAFWFAPEELVSYDLSCAASIPVAAAEETPEGKTAIPAEESAIEEEAAPATVEKGTKPVDMPPKYEIKGAFLWTGVVILAVISAFAGYQGRSLQPQRGAYARAGPSAVHHFWPTCPAEPNTCSLYDREHHADLTGIVWTIARAGPSAVHLFWPTCPAEQNICSLYDREHHHANLAGKSWTTVQPLSPTIADFIRFPPAATRGIQEVLDATAEGTESLLSVLDQLHGYSVNLAAVESQQRHHNAPTTKC